MAQHAGNTGSPIGGFLDGGRELAAIDQSDWKMGSLLRRIIDHVNRGFENAQVSGSGEVPAPKAPDSVSVKVSGEMMHVSIAHTGAVNRNVNYFTEVATDPNFTQPLVIHHGTSRTSAPINLPTKDDTGAVQSDYVRSYAQYPGGAPSEPTVVGGVGGAKAFTMNGSTQMTLLSSTGSGTASSTGQQGGSGFGKVQKRAE